MSEREERTSGHIERVRLEVRRMRGKYRLGIAPAHHGPVQACRSIRELWLVLGLTGPPPELHGDPLARDLKAFRGEAFVALELLADIEALVEGHNTELAGQLLPVLFARVNKLWRCCEGLKAKQGVEADDAAQRKLNEAKQAEEAQEAQAARWEAVRTAAEQQAEEASWADREAVAAAAEADRAERGVEA